MAKAHATFFQSDLSAELNFIDNYINIIKAVSFETAFWFLFSFRSHHSYALLIDASVIFPESTDTQLCPKF